MPPNNRLAELVEQNIAVKHILADGSIETQEHAIERLLAKLRVPGEDFFRTRDMAIDEAYTRQGKQIGFRELDEPQVGAARDDTSYGTAQ